LFGDRIPISLVEQEQREWSCARYTVYVNFKRSACGERVGGPFPGTRRSAEIEIHYFITVHVHTTPPTLRWDYAPPTPPYQRPCASCDARSGQSDAQSGVGISWATRIRRLAKGPQLASRHVVEDLKPADPFDRDVVEDIQRIPMFDGRIRVQVYAPSLAAVRKFLYVDAAQWRRGSS